MGSSGFFSGERRIYSIIHKNIRGNVNTHIYAQIDSSGATEVLYAEYPYTIRYIMNMNIFTYFITSGVI